MEKISLVSGVAVPFGLKNIDTDVIIPGRFLKRMSRTGLGEVTFDALRRTPNNLFDQPRNIRAPILLAGDNFGCGSSREHAVWGLADMGFRVVIAPSFADIFAGNAFKNGILLVTLDQEDVDGLMEIAGTETLTVDLETQMVSTTAGDRIPFETDPFRRDCLLGGLDEISLTETYRDRIADHEAWALEHRPWLACGIDLTTGSQT